MALKSGNSFGNFTRSQSFDPRSVKPIETEFSKGSVPNSLYTINRESAWARWRRGYEIATSSSYDNAYEYPFSYVIPVPTTGPAPEPTIPGVFVGYPTKNKELGMHWAGCRLAGSLRCDNLRDPVSGALLSIASVTEDDSYWYVTLAGSWSVSNPLPPPFYVSLPGVPGGLKPINGEILEDRVITPGGVPITRETIDPTTQKRYGFTQGVLTETDPFTGLLTIRKAGSIESTPDSTFITPADTPFHVGRFLITGSRYCCSCQDFTRRDYAFMSGLKSDSNKRLFPRNKIANIKPGRFERITLDGKLDSNAMTNATVNRKMQVLAPDSSYTVPPEVNISSDVYPGATRDYVGVYTEFGSTYLRSTPNPALTGSKAEGMPSYEDYSSSNGEITSITDYWTPLLDEMRYCKHIYAMKFNEGIFPPEPSDFPVEQGSMAAWEQRLIANSEKEQQEALDFQKTKMGLSRMDVPPYNCQAPMMMPMMQKLLNIPANFVVMQGFTMYDKDGNAYKPSLGEKPSV